MATNVEAAKLTNRIVYKTDKKSLKSVRDDMKKLQQDFSKTAPTIMSSPAAARAAVRNTKKLATEMADAHVKTMQDIIKSRSKQTAKNVQNSFNKILGVDKSPGKSARDSANVFKKAFADDSARVKRQNDEMARYTRDMLDQQKDVEKIRERVAKQALLARKNQEKRDTRAGVRSNQLAFEVSRLNLGANEAKKFSLELENLNRRYRTGKIGVDQYRESTRQLLRTTRDLSKEHMTLKERIMSLKKGGSGGLGLGGAIAGAGILAAGGAAYMGFNAGRDAIASAVAQSRGLSRVTSMGILPQETQALQLAALRTTGFDLSFEKISDIAKDTQDKIGQLSLGEWKQNKKTGDWAFSGGGEMSDWLKIMTERGGFSREGALKALRDVKGPVELAVLLEGLRKSAKLTDGEFTALAEAINDFSYIAKSVGAEGSNVVDTLDELRKAGLLYTQSQLDNMKDLSNMAATVQKYGEFAQGTFGAGFTQGLETMGINTKTLSDELAKVSPLVDSLGKASGEVTGWFLNLAGILANLTKWSEDLFGSFFITNPSSYFGEKIGNAVYDFFKNDQSSNTMTPGNIMSAPFSYGTGPGNSAWNPYNININPAPVVVQIEPSDEFGTMINARTDERIQWAFDDQSFQINQSLLGE